MKIAVPLERRPFESRVAATPETVKKLVQLGFKVSVEKSAGLGASIPDDAYKAVGAQIEKDPQSVYKNADIILKVQRPFLPSEGKHNELQYFKEGAVVCAHMNVLNTPEQIKTYAEHKITAVALEMIPRITRAQSMDILSSQSNLAGYRAVLEASYEYGKAFPMMMTAAGTIAPTRALILGAGVAGLQAIATAKRLGAVVSAFDVRAAAKEQVESLGAKFVEVKSEETGDTKSGYAKEMSDEYQKRQAQCIADELTRHDIVITTALIPGKPAPKLITEAMIKRMNQGSVIVDMAVENGGNCEKSSPGAVVEIHGVKIVGHLNLPARIASSASHLFSKNMLNFITTYTSEGKLVLDFSDEIITDSVLTHQGAVVNERFKK